MVQDRQRWRAAEERRTTECASLVQQQQATAVAAGAAREAALQAEISALQQRTADLEVLLRAAADDTINSNTCFDRLHLAGRTQHTSHDLPCISHEMA